MRTDAKRVLSLVLPLAALAAPPARAAEVDARAVTLLAGRPDVRDGALHTVVPIYQILSLQARQLDAPAFDDVRVVVSLWGRLDGADPADGNLADGDVELGYVEGALGRGRQRLTLRLGRQLVIAGAARAFGVDGVTAQSLLGPVGLTAFAGVPVTRRFEIDRGDATWGARASLRRSVDAELGLSYLHTLDNGRMSRLDLGVDGRLALSPRLALTGLGLLAASEMRLAEARLVAFYDPIPALRTEVEVSRVAPDLFLSRASILSVFSEERRDEAGAILTYRLRPRLALRGSYHALGLEEGLGHRATARVEATVEQARLGAETGVLTLADDGYLHGRLFAWTPLRPRMFGSLEGDLYRLEQERNGTRHSLRVAAAWRWDLARRWRAVVSGVVGSDPLYSLRWEGMAKLAFSLEGGGAR
jgi:hypothetical protein